MTTALTTNAYWDAVKDDVRPGDTPWDRGPQVGAPDYNDPEWWKRTKDRREMCSRYSWTITSPETVAFVALRAGPAVIDPMAGSGWWAHLLTEAGADVAASDLLRPGTDGNHWHRHDTHLPVTLAEGVAAVSEHGAGRTLLLSWPPYNDEAGADILAAYPGGRVIFIGEGAGGCCGDDRMFELLADGWSEVASHRPVQWYGIHDWVTVYDRKSGA